jgi:hypothetical protein
MKSTWDLVEGTRQKYAGPGKGSTPRHGGCPNPQYRPKGLNLYCDICGDKVHRTITINHIDYCVRCKP